MKITVASECRKKEVFVKDLMPGQICGDPLSGYNILVLKHGKFIFLEGEAVLIPSTISQVWKTSEVFEIEEIKLRRVEL